MADALVRALNQWGYQPVFLPQTGLQPPMLCNAEGGRLVHRGPLADKLPAAASLRKSKGRVADIEGVRTSEKAASGSIRFLVNAFRVLGIESPAIDIAFAGGSSLTFSFRGLLAVRVDPTKIDSLLVDLDTTAVPEDQIEAGKLHIAYEYLYASALCVSRSDGRSFGGDAQARLSEWFDIAAAGATTLRRNTVIRFERIGGERAAFAYKAGRLDRSRTGWTFRPEVVNVRRHVVTFESSTGGEPAREPRPYLPARGVVLDGFEAVDRPADRAWSDGGGRIR